MVWEAVGIAYKSKLLIVPGFVSAATYVDLLAQFMPDCDDILGHGRRVFVQDVAPAHTARETVLCVRDPCLSIPSWPANSPDLNPIEIVWGILKARLDWDAIKTRKQAIPKLREAWDGLSQDTIDALCRTFPTRVRMVGEAEGKAIQPLVSAHQTVVPDGYLADQETVEPHLETPEEDARLFHLLPRQGRHQWNEVTAQFEDRTRADVRRRVRQREMHDGNGHVLRGVAVVAQDPTSFDSSIRSILIGEGDLPGRERGMSQETIRYFPPMNFEEAMADF
jgi:hypothetical protein